MAASSAIRAGRAFVEIFADDSKAQKVLKRFQHRMQAFGASIRALGTGLFTAGAALLTPLVASTKVFTEMGDGLAKMSGRTGISVEALSELGYAAEQSGTDLQTLEIGVRTMQRVLDAARQGGQAAQTVFARLGLSLRDLQGLTPDEQFQLLADRLSRIPDPAMKAALAMQLFGRGGTALIPMLQAGAHGIEELREAARRLGLVISTEDAKAAEEFGDRMSDLWKVLKVSTFQIGAALAPAMVRLARIVTSAAKITADWLKQNRAAVVTVAAVAAGVVGAGVALIGLGTAISVAGAGVGVLAKSLVLAGTLAGGLKVAIAALLSPLGLVGVALGGLGGYMLHSSGVIDQAVSGIKTLFRDLTQDMLQGWQGVVDAVSAGDLELAFEVLSRSGMLAWETVTGFGKQQWAEFKSFSLLVFNEIVSGLSQKFINGFALVRAAWVETIAGIGTAINSLTTMFQQAVNGFSKLILGVMAEVDLRVGRLLNGLGSISFALGVEVEEYKPLNFKEALAELNQLNRIALDGTEKQQKLRQAGIETDRALRLKAIDDERRGMLESNQEIKASRQWAAEDERDATLKALRERLEASKQALAEKVSRAAERARTADQAGSERKIPDLASPEQMLAAGSSVMGTFSAAAASGLGAGRDWGQQIAANTQKTVDAVEELGQMMGGNFA